ncbi:hypothetical protein [uncultured Shewanella sp.]|uniref:hypothetical protein n=1 Tax=uncultured Shewanella sp. TaxID=173975 RepID=UPI002626775C|nr:hypothetical protein [uncultured Shewanella sp.]
MTVIEEVLVILVKLSPSSAFSCELLKKAVDLDTLNKHNTPRSSLIAINKTLAM